MNIELSTRNICLSDTMVNSEKACVVVDDEIEIRLSEEQMKYLNERSRLGRRSCDPNVTFVQSEDIELSQKIENTPKEVETVPIITVSSDSLVEFDKSRDNSDFEENEIYTQTVAEIDETRVESSIAETPRNDLSFVEDSDKESPFRVTCRNRQLCVPRPNLHLSADEKKSPALKRISETRTKRPEIKDNNENSPPAGLETPKTFEEKRFLSEDIEQLSSRMGKAVLSAQRKQLCQKSFQNCNYLDVKKLRSPNTKQVQSVLKTYINTSSPGRPLTPTSPEPSGKCVQSPRVHLNASPAVTRSPCVVHHESARLFGRPLATPKQLSSPAPLITIHHRPSPSSRKANPDEFKLRINESIYETYEVKMMARK